MTPPIDGTTAALRRHLAASPHDIGAHLDLAGALVEQVEADETHAPQAAELDEPIELLRTAAGLAADEDPQLRAPILLDLVDLLRLRFDVQGELGDLSTAIAYEQQILDVLVTQGEDQTGVLYQLGLDFAVRHDQQTETAPDDLRQALACLRELRALIGDDHPGRPELAIRLGLMLGYSVLQAVEESSDEDFAEAIEELTLARNAPVPEEDVTETDAADTWLVRFRLGMLHAFRYLNRGGDAQDRDVAIGELTDLINHPDTPSDQADRCHLSLALLEYMRAVPPELRRGQELLTQGGQTRLWEMMPSLIAGNSADTALAVRHHLDAMSELSAADPELSLLIRGLRAGTLTHDGQKSGSISTSALNDTASWLEDVTPEFAKFGATNELTVLKAGVRATLAQRSGDLAETAAATDLVTAATSALDEDHPLRGAAHNLLGSLAGTLSPEASAEDIAIAIATIERILAELPDDHPDRARTLTKASASLYLGMCLNRSSVSFDRVRDMLNQAIQRPAADDVNDSLNHFLLGFLNGMQGTFEHNIALIDSGIDLLNKASKTVPEGHQLRDLIGPGLGLLLYGRAMTGGDLEDYDAASFYAGPASAEDDLDPTGSRSTMRAMGEYLAVSAKLARKRHDIDHAQIDETIEKITAIAETLPDDHFLRREIAANVDALLLARKGLDLASGRVDGASVSSASFTANVDLLLAAARDTPAGRLDHTLATGTAAMALVGQAFLTRDHHAFDRGIGMLEELRSTPELTSQERLSALGCLSMSLRMRYEHFRSPRDLNEAIEHLEQAQLLIQQNPPDGADAAPILHLLGDCYHERADPRRGDRHRAVEVGLLALRERASDVLLQNSPGHALDTALAARGEASDVARWCLTAKRNDAAVAALELGRAIVLHFATIDAGIPEVLRSGGHPALAAEWEAASDRMVGTGKLPWSPGQDPAGRAAATMLAGLGQGTTAIPGDLRRRVLEAVDGTDVHAQLLAPPSVADITTALSATSSDALVYLVAADERQPGLAVIVHADGMVQTRLLSRLRGGAGTVFEAFSQARRALTDDGAESAREEAWQRWQSRVDQVCDWAWAAAMNDVLSILERVPGEPPVRLVLVPTGELAAVPWHAARRRMSSGAWRYACHDAVIIYASSAGQFVNASQRHQLPWASAPAVVCGSDDVTSASAELPFASEETNEIHRRFYPQGTYLGPGQGGPTATRVRDLLPSKHSAGASVLHLACHATLANPPIDSFLELADNSTLYVRDMLEQARERPADAGGGLVILAACESDLTGGAHDEALTLATAFLAAGSAGVIGAQWPVDDAPTALFMVMFHYYLNSGYHDPATALCAAQQWMLDKQRQLPEGIGQRLADELHRPDLTETANWAAFTYQGQ